MPEGMNLTLREQLMRLSRRESAPQRLKSPHTVNYMNPLGQRTGPCVSSFWLWRIG